MLEIYSKSRPHVWPGSRRVYVLPSDGEEHSYPISCYAGEYICYGAWVGRQPQSYWGAGRGGRQGCTDCCYYCRGGETEVRNLVNGGEAADRWSETRAMASNDGERRPEIFSRAPPESPSLSRLKW